MNLQPPKLVQEAVSLGVNSTTTHIDGRGFSSGSFHFIWSGANALDGQVQIQVSNDPTKTNWEDKDGAFLTLAGPAGSRIINVSSLSEAYARIKYTKNGNTTGLINCYFVGKGGAVV